MTNTKSRDEAFSKYYDDINFKEPLDFSKDVKSAWDSSWDACLEKVLKAVGKFNADEATEAFMDSRCHTSLEDFRDGARHQHDQIIKKIKAASSGETRVLSDKVARGSKGDVG